MYLTVKRLMLTINAKLFYLLRITILMHKKNECLSLVINNMIDWFRMTFDMCVGFLIWRKFYYFEVELNLKSRKCRVIYFISNSGEKIWYF